jgi:hypothetical protein
MIGYSALNVDKQVGETDLHRDNLGHEKVAHNFPFYPNHTFANRILCVKEEMTVL